MKNIRVLVFSALALMTAAAQATTYTGSITSNTFLYAGDYVRSATGTYTLAMQSDGNLVIYLVSNTGAMTPKWAIGATGAGSYAVLQKDGNFVVYRSDNTAAWSSVTGGRPSSADYKLTLQDSGELDIYAPGGTAPIWAGNAAICGANTGTLPYTSYPVCYIPVSAHYQSSVGARCVAEAVLKANAIGAVYGGCPLF